MENSKNSRSRDQIEWFESIVFALTVLVLVFTFVVRVAAVNGISMENTLQPGDRLLLQSVGYTPQRGDVVVTDDLIDYGEVFQRGRRVDERAHIAGCGDRVGGGGHRIAGNFTEVLDGGLAEADIRADAGADGSAAQVHHREFRLQLVEGCLVGFEI